ncbi:MAG: hypothetical protein WA463_08180 [Terriglobales bacterium]
METALLRQILKMSGAFTPLRAAAVNQYKQNFWPVRGEPVTSRSFLWNFLMLNFSMMGKMATARPRGRQ